MLALRLVLVFVPNTWLWGLNVQRFADPVFGWVALALMALAVVPPIAKRAAPALDAFGDVLLHGGWLSSLGAALAAAALVYAFPDQVRFVGDFLLRQGTVEMAAQPAELFPQALPLDVFMHYTLPLWIGNAGFGDANTAARLIGAVEAGLLALCAVAFVRALVLPGVAATAAFAVVLFGGYLGMFTGYSKAFADLVVIVAATGVFGLMALRGRGGLLPLGIVVAVGLTLHRSALGLLPAAAFAWFLWLRDRQQAGELKDAARRPDVIAAIVIPVAALAVMVPRIVSTIVQFDTVHFTPLEVEAEGGVLRSALAGTRAADLVNLMLMLSPLALAIPVLAFAVGKGMRRGREFGLLLLLLGPLVAFWPFIHPVHGMFRDWDDFAFTGVAFSLVVAWLVGETLRPVDRKPSANRWVGVAVALAVAVPSVQWIALHSDLDRGLARVRAFIEEAPERTPAQRGYTWDYLGIRNFRLDRYAASADAFAHAAETAPSPRILQQWAAAETELGDYEEAQRVYWKLLERAPDQATGWLGLAAVSSRFGDMNESIYAANRLLELQPNNPDARDILNYWASLPAAVRDSLDRLYPPRDSLDRR